MAVLMPITSPRVLTSAPPELPGLIGASVWSRPEIELTAWLCCWPGPAAAPSPARMVRSRALRMPEVTEPWRPSGLPRASTWSPTCMASLSPNLAGLRSLTPLAFTTARSVFGSVPMIFAVGGLAVGEDHPYGAAGGGGDHVVVGQHVPVGAEHHPGALAAVGGDRDDAVLHGSGDLRQVGAVDHRRRRVGAGDAAAVAVEGEGEGPAGDAGAEHQGEHRDARAGELGDPTRPGAAAGRRDLRAPRRDRLARLLRVLAGVLAEVLGVLLVLRRRRPAGPRRPSRTAGPRTRARRGGDRRPAAGSRAGRAPGSRRPGTAARTGRRPGGS